MLMVMVYLKFGEILQDSHQPVNLCATLSIIQSPPFLRSESFDFKGKSLRIQRCFKDLFVTGFIKILYM